jgi:hypothetical protein
MFDINIGEDDKYYQPIKAMQKALISSKIGDVFFEIYDELNVLPYEKTNKKDFYNNEWKIKQKSWNYNYRDSYDGEVIPTIIYVDEREWKPKWLKWISLFNKTRRTIDIHFSKEIGKRKGSWKGGTIGCSYELLSNETPLDCLKRMEKVRKF